ncbi:hypothetical protein [Virgibacillus pantothenticus]|jgi:hypothetical protein|nr:hypothetical protein [Virgibacillus pantothenticus]MEB5453811.1 hypothetical protein [Virgibacillus pantothenticus]MEB5458070.1 hypothetical protein [Virgibacillus pantothenticus]MEB5462335.1 hypothetical protein [Virgibacillus pantothenticus]MEB5466325.1 hypothetical protein [Virgibacillus pantothenticus]MEB5470654.1 hypothetical protein [Virgibacillus pantothenticus]
MFQVDFTFAKIDLKKEKWEYHISFQVDEKNIDDIYETIKKYDK